MVRLGVLGNTGRVLLIIGAVLVLGTRLHGDLTHTHNRKFWLWFYTSLGLFLVGAAMAFIDFTRLKRRGQGERRNRPSEN
jgi:hypothetical protein